MRTYLSFLNAGIMEDLDESTKWEPSYITQERIRKQAEELGKKLGRLEGLEEGLELGVCGALTRSAGRSLPSSSGRRVSFAFSFL